MPQAEPILDPATLDANTMNDPSLQRELLDLYAEHAPALLENLDAALRTGSSDEWVHGAHGIKGMARTLGLIRLERLAAAAEASRQPSTTVRATLGAEVETGLDAAATHVAAQSAAAAPKPVVAAIPARFRRESP